MLVFWYSMPKIKMMNLFLSSFFEFRSAVSEEKSKIKTCERGSLGDQAIEYVNFGHVAHKRS